MNVNKKYWMYGLGILSISLLLNISFDSQKATNAYSNRIESNVHGEADEVKEEGSSDNESKYLEGDEEESREDIKDDKDNTEESEKLKENGKYEIVEVFNTKLSSNFTVNIQYEKYPMDFSYVVVAAKNANIREEPTSEAAVLKSVSRNEKINLIEAVKGEYIDKYESAIWYKVYWEDKEERIYGYILGKLSEVRSFRINEMEIFLKRLKFEVDNNKTAHISNYKNFKGAAPLYKGKAFDKYGQRRYQSAPAYIDLDYKSEFRYIPDGALLSVLEEQEKFIKVRTLNFKGEYWVPKKYVSFENSIEELKRVLVVDRKNQNVIVFEYKDDGWSLISYALATTGKKGRYRLETPLGYYMVIEKRPSFLYYKDGTKKIAGYAPYAIRFTGGIYLHGIPVNFKYIEGKRVNPGLRETSSTIGTIPLSHGCVRNNTSHAKFLYDWIGIGESAIIVIDELHTYEFSTYKGELLPR